MPGVRAGAAPTRKASRSRKGNLSVSVCGGWCPGISLLTGATTCEQNRWTEDRDTFAGQPLGS